MDDDLRQILEGTLYTASVINAIGFLYKVSKGIVWATKKLRKIFRGGRHAKK